MNANQGLRRPISGRAIFHPFAVPANDRQADRNQCMASNVSPASRKQRWQEPGQAAHLVGRDRPHQVSAASMIVPSDLIRQVAKPGQCHPMSVSSIQDGNVDCNVRTGDQLCHLHLNNWVTSQTTCEKPRPTSGSRVLSEWTPSLRRSRKPPKRRTRTNRAGLPASDYGKDRPPSIDGDDHTGSGTMITPLAGTFWPPAQAVASLEWQSNVPQVFASVDLVQPR